MTLSDKTAAVSAAADAVKAERSVEMIKPITADCLSRLPGVNHGFFTRHGGASSGIYGSLNCGLGSNDETAIVKQNRSRIARFLGANDLVTVYQVHGATAVVVDTQWPDGIDPPRADAIVTGARGLAIGTLTADCTPILLADAESGVIAAAHAGWRGAVRGVLEATIATMVNIGATRSAIHAALGPCINQPAYQVGPEFEAEILALSTDNKRFFTRSAGTAKPHFDLPGFIESQVERAGIATFERQSACTFANGELLFSYRRSQHNNEADYGRQISAIVLA